MVTPITLPVHDARPGAEASATSARTLAGGCATSRSMTLPFSHGVPPIHVAREKSLLHSGQRSTSVKACQTDSALQFAVVECSSLIDIGNQFLRMVVMASSACPQA